MSSSPTPDGSSEFHDAPESIVEDDGDSDWESTAAGSKRGSPRPNLSETDSPEPTQPPNPSDQVDLALDEIRELYAGPVTDSPLPYDPSEIYEKPMVSLGEIKELNTEVESIMERLEDFIGPFLPRPGMWQKWDGCANSLEESPEYSIAELGLYRIRNSHLRKAIKELKIANSPMLASLHRQDPSGQGQPLTRKRQCPGSPHKHESYPGPSDTQFSLPIAPPTNEVTSMYRSVSLVPGSFSP